MLTVLTPVGRVDEFLQISIDAIKNQTSTTDEIYVKIKELVAYLKVDMTNAVGVQITYIDNDGD